MKKYKFAEGGDVEMEEGSGGYGALPDTPVGESQTFKKAFASARSSGDKSFTWRGKKYTTATAPDKAPAPAPAEAATRVGTERGRASVGDAATRVGTERGRASVRPPPKPATGVPVPPRRPGDRLSDVERPGTNVRYENEDTSDMSYKKGGKVKAYAKGGAVRGGGCETKGKTKGRMV